MASAREIFVVGKPRSGTSLIRAVLAGSPAVRLSRGLPYLQPPSFWRAFVDLCLSRPPCKMKKTALSRRGDLLDTTSAADLSVIADGKALPNVHYLPALVERYPAAKFVHVVRDIRGVYCSQATKWRRKGNNKHRGRTYRLVHRVGFANGLYSFLTVSVIWQRLMQLDEYYSARYPDHYFLVKYEDFLANPELVTRSMCDFIGIPYRQSMLDVQFDNSSFRRPERPIEHGIDAARARRWEDSNLLATNVLRLIAKKQLRRLGYE